MAVWFSENIGTIIVSLILSGIVAAIIANMVKKKKQGKTTCGYGCASCAMRGACHKNTQQP